MASDEATIYVLTVRPHRDRDDCFEYVLSRPGSEPMLSDEPYPTYEAAKDAGDKRGREFGLEPGPSSADE